MNKLSLAVVIVSKDRTKKLFKCLQSIEKNTVLPDELIIINKGEKFVFLDKLKKLKKIAHVIQQENSNLSKGRNLGINMSKSDIICFTDDDCIVFPDWLENIKKSFVNHPECAGVFGQVFPYQAKKHPNAICPCTFLKNKAEIISSPIPHMTGIGYGNNMSFRAKTFKNLGLFKTWLSAGSLGKSTEDAEFALRILIHKQKIFFNPKVTIFHNRWLNKAEIKKQELSYMSGKITCYSYFAFQGYEFAKPIIWDDFSIFFYQLKLIIKNLLKLKFSKNNFSNIFNFLIEFYFKLRALAIGFLFSLIDRVN